MRVFLIGFMGAGKSTVGALLAERLGVPFVDLDRSIEEHESLSIPEIFKRHDEDEFRRLEVEALDRVMAFESAVVATGGGIVSRQENIETMQSAGAVVWLNPALEMLTARLESARHTRPLFDNMDHARELFERRLPGYRRADHQVDIGEDESSSEVAKRIAKLLRGNRCAT